MIYFQRISDNINSKDYLNKRLEKFLNSFPPEQQSLVLKGLAEADGNGVLPHFVPVRELAGAIAAAEEEAVVVTKKAAEEMFPLTPNEQIEDEELCALMMSRSGIEKASLFLLQTTNFAQTFIQVPDMMVKDGRITSISETDPALSIEQDIIAESAAAAVNAVPVWALALAKQLGQKLLEYAGAAIWDVVRKEVLGQTDLPSYYEQVYAEIREIVSSAFQEHYIKEVKDLASKFEHAMDYYNHMGRKEIDFLTVKDTSFDLITKSNSLGLPGTFHYAEASILHIMTLQEGYKRLVEEGAKPEELQKSKDYISRLASQFSDNVTTKHKLLVEARMATINTEPFAYYGFSDSPKSPRTIGGVKEGVYDYDGTFLYSCAPVQNMFKDDTNGFWNSMYYHLLEEIKDPGHSWRWVNNNLQRYRQQIYNETLSELSSLLDVAERLRQLAAKPVTEA